LGTRAGGRRRDQPLALRGWSGSGIEQSDRCDRHRDEVTSKERAEEPAGQPDHVFTEGNPVVCGAAERSDCHLYGDSDPVGGLRPTYQHPACHVRTGVHLGQPDITRLWALAAHAGPPVSAPRRSEVHGTGGDRQQLEPGWFNGHGTAGVDRQGRHRTPEHDRRAQLLRGDQRPLALRTSYRGRPKSAARAPAGARPGR